MLKEGKFELLGKFGIASFSCSVLSEKVYQSSITAAKQFYRELGDSDTQLDLPNHIHNRQKDSLEARVTDKPKHQESLLKTWLFLKVIKTCRQSS